MSMITDVWQQMLQRRLWPLAVLLLGALVAVPVLLAKDPVPAPAPSTALPAPTAKAESATAAPVVALADEGTARRRRVLGARKDPFRPAPMPKVKPAKVAAPAGGATGAQPAGGASGSGGSPAPSGGGGTPGAPAPGPVVTPPKKKTYPGDSLTVRFASGDAAGAPKSVLQVGQGLPVDTAADGQPLLVYLGLGKGGKEALFLVDAAVVADGDGHCDGDGGATCETLHLRAGETEFLDVTDDTGAVTAKFQLDLLSLHPSKQTLQAAKAARARNARAAKSAKAHMSLAGVANASRAALGAGVAALLAGL
jgi:hypothetical protein